MFNRSETTVKERKERFFHRLLLISAMILIFIVSSSLLNAGEMTEGQQTAGIQPIRGERPFIDLDKVPQDAYEPGKLRIKLDRSMEDKILNEPIKASPEGYVITDQKDLDELNRIFSVQQYRPMLYRIYDVSPASEQYRDRHRAWGFHLWYELTIDSKSDVIEAVKSFKKLSSIEIAEPVYRIERILPRQVSGPISLEEAEAMHKSRFTPNDPMYPDYQWHFNNTGQVIQGQAGTPGCDVSAENAWDIEKGWSEVIVAVIDGGIDYNHIELKPNMWPDIGPDGTGTLPCSENHGTHVGGTISVVTNNNIGIAGLAGGSGADDGSGNLGSGDGVRLMSIDLFDGSHGLDTYEMNLYAADNGAAISQNSWGWGSPGYYQQSDLDGIDYFNQHGGGSVLNGGLTVFAAGNSNSSSNWYPAYYSGAMAVAGTDNRDIRYISSNYGSWVEISAPGVDVFSTYNDNYVGFMTGTSMSCPHVSGAAALIVSYAARNGLTLTATQVRDILKDTTDDHYPLNPSYTGLLGTGRLNAHAALLEVQNLLASVQNPTDFQATALSETKIDLSWTRNPDNDDVMLVWSSDGVFGSPVDGVSYTVGNTVPGGGIVLYRGSSTGYDHTSLSPNTLYYYKAFSYNASVEYSPGVTASARTFCTLIDTLPFSENFDASSSLPDCWEILDHQGNGQVWQIGTGGGLSGTTGNWAYLDSDSHGSGNSQNSDLISPVFDFSNYSDIVLEFTHYYRHYASSATLSYTINNGSTWDVIQTWTANTSNPAYFSEMIQEVAGQSDVRFKWNYTGTWGWYWSVDDIIISGTPISPTHTVTLLADPHDIGVILTGAGSYEAGVRVDIEAALPGKAWLFIEWMGDMGKNITDLLDDPYSPSTFFTMPDYDVIFTAKYEWVEPEYTVTLLADPDDIGAVLTGAGDYIEGDKVDISVILLKEYEFTGWTGTYAYLLDDPSSASTFFTMPADDVTLTANFEWVEPEYTVTFTVTDFETALPIEGAVIAVQPDDSRQGWSEHTGPAGQASFLLEDGDYTYTVSAYGYAQTAGNFQVDGADIEDIPVAMTPELWTAAVSIEHPYQGGVYLWSYGLEGSEWQKVMADNPALKLMAGDILNNGWLELVGNFEGFGLWYYDIARASWHILSAETPNDFTIANTPSGIQVIASSTRTRTISALLLEDSKAGWNVLINASAQILAALNIDKDVNHIDELVIVNSAGVWVYDFVLSAITRIWSAAADKILIDDITGDGYDEIVATHSTGIWLGIFTEGSKGEMTIEEKYPFFDISGKQSSPKSGKGLGWTRILSLVPDQGIGTGDITALDGSEVIISHKGAVYYYSYDDTPGYFGWTMIPSIIPFYGVISGDFSYSALDDLLLFHAGAGADYIYLWRSADHTLELIMTISSGGYVADGTALE